MTIPVKHWVVGGGTGSNTATQYTTKAEAETQAQTLAALHPTEVYTIYQAVGYATINLVPVRVVGLN